MRGAVALHFVFFLCHSHQISFFISVSLFLVHKHLSLSSVYTVLVLYLGMCITNHYLICQVEFISQKKVSLNLYLPITGHWALDSAHKCDESV